jgi:hypothetical protein
MLISALDEDADGSLSVAARRIGGPLFFRSYLGAMLGELLGHRAFEFAVERAVFVSTLHRLFVTGISSPPSYLVNRLRYSLA